MKPFCGYVNGIWGSKGGREQRGSKQVAWIESFSQIWGLFQGFGAFSGIRGLFWDSGPFRGFGAFFGDSRPFSGIRGFAAFSQIRGLFADLQPFLRFTAFSRICGLFTDLRPFCRFADSRPRERTSHLVKLSLPDIFRFTLLVLEANKTKK